MPAAVDLKRALIVPNHPDLSIRRQCELLDLNRSSYYLPQATAPEEDLRLMRAIDELYLKRPFFGSRRMVRHLEFGDDPLNRKRVQRLMRIMGIEGLHPCRGTTLPADSGTRIYPYLLRDRELTHVDQVWGSDITYVPTRGGFMYLTAVIDWYSRYVLSWLLSNTLDAGFCLEALEESLSMGRPEIFNTDQGVQIHRASVQRPAGGGEGRGEHGRSGACVGQRARGTVLEERQIRKHLHEGL